MWTKFSHKIIWMWLNLLEQSILILNIYFISRLLSWTVYSNICCLLTIWHYYLMVIIKWIYYHSMDIELNDLLTRERIRFIYIFGFVITEIRQMVWDHSKVFVFIFMYVIELWRLCKFVPKNAFGNLLLNLFLRIIYDIFLRNGHAWAKLSP